MAPPSAHGFPVAFPLTNRRLWSSSSPVAPTENQGQAREEEAASVYRYITSGAR